MLFSFFLQFFGILLAFSVTVHRESEIDFPQAQNLFNDDLV